MRKPGDHHHHVGLADKEKANSGSPVVKAKLRKGLWSPEEDEKLMNYIMMNGQGCWSDIAQNAGLLRCGKSYRLRWINYLRPERIPIPFTGRQRCQRFLYVYDNQKNMP